MSTTLTQPPVLSQHWKVLKRDAKVIQRSRSGYAGPVTVNPNQTWIRQIEQTGFCSSDQIVEIENGEQDSTATVTNLDGMNTGKWGQCWKVSTEIEPVPTASQKPSVWSSTLNTYRIVWQQTTYAAPTFS